MHCRDQRCIAVISELSVSYLRVICELSASDQLLTHIQITA